jgi:hypothetical protein
MEPLDFVFKTLNEGGKVQTYEEYLAEQLSKDYNKVSTCVGIDIGKVNDPTAIVVSTSTGDSNIFKIPYLRRIPTGLSYVEIIERITQVLDNLVDLLQSHYSKVYAIPKLLPKTETVARNHLWVMVDATGVGQPVVDLLREARPKLRITAVTFTGGNEMDVSLGSKRGSLPKSYMVSRLQALFAVGRVELPDTPETEALISELQDYEVRVSDSGRESYGAFKEGAHDDLVTALGLATLCDLKPVKQARSYQYF